MAKEPRFFKVETDGAVVIWRFHNPPKNLWSTETATEFDDLVEAFYEDDDLRAGIMTSAMPDVFIQHFDVSLLVQWSEALRKGTAPAIPTERPAPRGVQRVGPKPTIAAINATVGGGGLELSMAFDFRFMSRSASASQGEVSVGIIPPSGSQRMTRLVGLSKALELMLTGRPIFADEAERIGLITRACDPLQLMPAALAFAKELALRPPLGVALTKRAIYEGIDMPLQDGLALAMELFWQAMTSEEALQRMSAYVAAGQEAGRLQQAEQSQG